MQSHWNGSFYGYTGSSGVECEMGGFARIVSEYYREKQGDVPYWDRILQDLNYKLLASGWQSPGWTTPGVIVHADSNPQLRLWETLSAITALHQLFPQFTSDIKQSFTDLLMSEPSGWQGLIASPLNEYGYFRSVFPGAQASNDATACAAATLFLEGIVPVTGSLAMSVCDENFPFDATPFPATQLKFDNENHRIKIPVNTGELTFIFGLSPVTYDFIADGVYDIEFSNDWNEIISVNDQPISKKRAPPQNLEATEGSKRISLSWSAPEIDGDAEITTYHIYRGNVLGKEDFLQEIETPNLTQTYMLIMEKPTTIGSQPLI